MDACHALTEEAGNKRVTPNECEEQLDSEERKKAARRSFLREKWKRQSLQKQLVVLRGSFWTSELGLIDCGPPKFGFVDFKMVANIKVFV